MDDFFAELESDIAQQLAADQLRKDREAAKKKANTLNLPSATRQRAAEEYRSISKLLEASEWQAVSTIALFSEQACDGCGSVHRTFLQYMELQQMVKKPTTQRWVRISKPRSDLPRESLLQPMATHICADCCEDHGFALLSGQKLPLRETLGPSFTYHQEDINAQTS